MAKGKTLDTKIKDLNVNEFFDLLESWHQKKEEEKRQQGEEWTKGIRELAKFLNCSMATAYRYVHKGLFPDAVVLIGGTYYFSKRLLSDIDPRKRRRSK